MFTIVDYSYFFLERGAIRPKAVEKIVFSAGFIGAHQAKADSSSVRLCMLEIISAIYCHIATDVCRLAISNLYTK